MILLHVHGLSPTERILLSSPNKLLLNQMSAVWLCSLSLTLYLTHTNEVMWSGFTT